ncbi:MAG TPA: CHAT domain-containing protein, partial [Chloroflexota bacterium]|nr:CHAT domain-containing protein [Chloroflexota bacterium]
VAPVVEDLDGAGRLLVVPHGALHYAPFHAFVGPDGRPLVEQLEVSYAPSASVLGYCLERGALAHGPEQPLVMGVPDEAAPHVATEVAALRRLFGRHLVFCGKEATGAVFRRHAPDADVIHLASHAVFREDNPLFSALRLADGWLSLYDLYKLRLRAALVALSACETGLSAVGAGDELVGLSRGFFQAGTPSLVVSLWAVHDESTARLMERFYARLRAGDRPGAAMRAAQTELRHAHPHPYYWAPFVVVGRP